MGISKVGAPADGSRARTRHGGGAFAAVLFTLLGLLGVPGTASAQLTTDPGTVIQIIDTSLWTPPSPDPSGITYLPETGEFLTCDAEVDEMTIYAGANLWFHSNSGVVSSTLTTTAYSNEAAGVAFDPAGGRAWVADDNAARIFQVEFGLDGTFGTADDFVSDLDGIAAAGCDDVEDVTYNHLDGHLYVSSGLSQEICEIDPGLDGEFNGALPTGDDIVTTFSVVDFGIQDPEGIVYDPFWNTLVVADRRGRALYELTSEGGVLRKIAANFPAGSKISGVTIAPGSTNASLRNYWVTDRRQDNIDNPLENDGRIYEVVAIPLGGNGAPIVDAGAPQSLEWPANSVELDGFVNDDGHPYPPSTVLALWSQLSGPGSVTFEDSGSPDTTATFSAPGEYLLQLLGDDSAAQTTDTVAVTVNHTVTLSVTATGPGAVTLDPPGGSYPAGTSVTVTATPDLDATFTGWSGDLSGTTNPETVVLDAAKSVSAGFATLYDVSVAASGPGEVILDPPGGSYPEGTVVTVEAAPEEGAVFEGFDGSLTGTDSPQVLMVDSDETVIASFEAVTYTLSVATQGAGTGTVSVDPPTGPYAAGTIVTLTPVPGAGSVFGGWSGDATGSANPLLLVVDADKAVSATFNTTGGGGGASCGIGPELVAAMPLLAWLHGRRRRAAPRPH
jgi:hypothetical protein